MFRHRKKIIAIMAAFLALLLLISLFAMAMPALRAGAESNLTTLKNKKANLQSQKNTLANELAALKSEEQSAMSEKVNLEEQIEVLTEQITTSEEIIAALDEQITIKTEEIAEAEAQEAEEYELFRKRVRAMEENKTTSYLGILLGAGSFSELLSRLEVINDIMTYDRDLMADMKSTRERKERAKQELEADRTESATIKRELEDQRAEAEEKTEQVNALLEQITSDYQFTANEISRIESDIAAAQKEISRIEEEQRKAEEARRKAEEEKLRAAEQAKYVGGKFLWPLPSPYYSDYITQGFKYRVHQFTGKYGLHGGIDIGCPSGTSIYAANSGTVVTSTMVKSYGNYVMIDHGGSVYTLYAHMSKRLVNVGDKVTRGQVIGKVGMSGYATGPHLHFEIRKNGNYVNPMNEF